jgi:flagellar biosynthesis/type III secretory pathway protein FliH
LARVIRGFRASAVVPREVGGASARAAAIIADAEARATALLEDARREAEAQRAEARAAGERDAHAAVASLLALAEARRDRALAEAAEEVVTLAVAVARRVIGEIVERERTLVTELARDAIERARGASRLTLAVSTADAEALTSFAATHRLPLTVEVDAALERGDCVVRSEVGTIDARLDTQLAALRRALLRQLEREAT